MKLGIVRGTVVLSKCEPALTGTRLLVVEPVTAENLAAKNGKGGGKHLIAADHLGPAVGQMVAYEEGGQAASPYRPKMAPVDVYCALIVENADFHPPRVEPAAGSEEQK
jgi:microcompartment protein CcmK/EutM